MLKNLYFKRGIALWLLFFFFANTIRPVSVYAQGFSINSLPVPGQMVSLSSSFVPVLIRGVLIHPDKPLNFDFILDSGNDTTDQKTLKEEGQRMVKYFLAALTVPAKELWVNLSPYEKGHIIPSKLGETELGRDMLAQDYVLKQITASLIYPEKGLGKEFWDRVYTEAREKFGVTDIPVNTFNKVWIMPATAEVFEKGNAVYVTRAKLKVMMDEDYLALMKNKIAVKSSLDNAHALTSQVVRQIVIPVLEKEVNEGKNFAPLRQIYYAAILAKWYRQAITKSLLSQVYIDKNKINGIDLEDKTLKEQIYERYISAYKKGVFNYIKEDLDSTTGQSVPRKYFSGGLTNSVGWHSI